VRPYLISSFSEQIQTVKPVTQGGFGVDLKKHSEKGVDKIVESEYSSKCAVESGSNQYAPNLEKRIV
jgi:hypothetical protein